MTWKDPHAGQVRATRVVTRGQGVTRGTAILTAPHSLRVGGLEVLEVERLVTWKGSEAASFYEEVECLNGL